MSVLSSSPLKTCSCWTSEESAVTIELQNPLTFIVYSLHTYSSCWFPVSCQTHWQMLPFTKLYPHCCASNFRILIFSFTQGTEIHWHTSITYLEKVCFVIWSDINRITYTEKLSNRRVVADSLATHREDRGTAGLAVSSTHLMIAVKYRILVHLQMTCKNCLYVVKSTSTVVCHLCFR